VSKLRLAGGVQRCPLKKSPGVSSGTILIGVVGREQDAVDPHDLDAPLQIALAEHPARGHIEVFARVGGEWSGEPGRAVEHRQSLEVEQDHLAPVAQDDLQARKPVEDARER
jgi:hypothetical protein